MTIMIPEERVAQIWRVAHISSNRLRMRVPYISIEDIPAQAENMKLRSSLMTALEEHIRSEGLTPTEAAKKFGVTQPRISDLTRGRIDLFSIDMLVNMLATVGLHIELHIAKAT